MKEKEYHREPHARLGESGHDAGSFRQEDNMNIQCHKSWPSFGPAISCFWLKIFAN
jgi:hypothetical protein